MTDAKDQEIEHLRSWLHRVLYETGCTRGQHTTQWCEEARVVKDELAAARAEIERLKERNADLREKVDDLEDEIGNLTCEVKALKEPRKAEYLADNRSTEPMSKNDVLEFVRALEDYRVSMDRPFPSWGEVLLVLRQLGYRKAELAKAKEAP